MKKRMEELVEADLTADDLQKELFKAIDSDEGDRVELLLNALGVDYKNDHIDSSLIEAAYLGKINCVKKLLDLGADVNAVSKSVDQKSALEAAAGNGYLEVVRCLLNTGQVKQADKNQAFSVASGSEEDGHIECMQELFDHGNGVDMEFFEYEHGEFSLTTALGVAINASCMDSIDWLLAHGANVNAMDKSDNESILESVIYKNRADILNKILETGRADLSTLVQNVDVVGEYEEEFEQTLMEYAEEIGSTECLKVLKDYQKRTEDLQKLIHAIGFEKCLEVLQQYQSTHSDAGQKRHLDDVDYAEDDEAEESAPKRSRGAEEAEESSAMEDVAPGLVGVGSSDVEGDLGTIGEACSSVTGQDGSIE